MIKYGGHNSSFRSRRPVTSVLPEAVSQRDEMLRLVFRVPRLPHLVEFFFAFRGVGRLRFVETRGGRTVGDMNVGADVGAHLASAGTRVDTGVAHANDGCVGDSAHLIGLVAISL